MKGWHYLDAFCSRAAQDGRLQPTHISLYLALLREWGRLGATNPFPVSRRDVMQLACIRSRVTYHRRMLELHAWGYLCYDPTYDYYRGTRVCLKE